MTLLIKTLPLASKRVQPLDFFFLFLPNTQLILLVLPPLPYSFKVPNFPQVIVSTFMTLNSNSNNSQNIIPSSWCFYEFQTYCYLNVTFNSIYYWNFRLYVQNWSLDPYSHPIPLLLNSSKRHLHSSTYIRSLEAILITGPSLINLHTIHH